MTSKNRARDLAFNVGASMVSVGAIQLIALPLVSRTVSPSQYGSMLLLVGIMNAAGVALGNPLNNTRLLVDKQYSVSGTAGDFQLIFRGGQLLVLISVGVVIWLAVPETSAGIVIGVALSALLVFSRAYHSVGYRLHLNFRAIFTCSLWGFLGCSVGLLVHHVTGYWVAVFLFSELAQVLYIGFTSHTVKEAHVFTRHFSATLRRFVLLAVAGSIGAAMPYVDRFLLYPALGAHSVSIFVTASYLGKLLNGLAVPISSFLLAYEARTKSFQGANIWRRLMALIAACSVGLLSIVLVDSWVIGLLFPTLVDAARPYFTIANGGAVLGALGVLLNPWVMRWCHSRYVLLIQVLHLTAFILFAFLGVQFGGLQGFCWGVVAANLLRVATMLGTLRFLAKAG